MKYVATQCVPGLSWGSVFAISPEGYLLTIGNLFVGWTPCIIGANMGSSIAACHNSKVVCIVLFFKRLETGRTPCICYNQFLTDFEILCTQLNWEPLALECQTSNTNWRYRCDVKPGDKGDNFLLVSGLVWTNHTLAPTLYDHFSNPWPQFISPLPENKVL